MKNPLAPCLSLATLLLAVSPAPAADYAFIGTWDCEVATFTFTNRTYNNGSETLTFSAIHFGKGQDVRLDFPKNYRISLMNVTARTMTWHSLVSGDTFACKRLK